MSKETIDREKRKLLQVARLLQVRLQSYMNFADRIGRDEIISDRQVEELKNSKEGLMLEVAELSSALNEIISIAERT